MRKRHGVREQREEAANKRLEALRAPQGPLWRRQPGEQQVLGRDGVVAELPSSGRELKDSRPRRRPGARPKVTDKDLQQHLDKHPDLSDAKRARILSLHPQTVARKRRVLTARRIRDVRLEIEKLRQEPQTDVSRAQIAQLRAQLAELEKASRPLKKL